MKFLSLAILALGISNSFATENFQSVILSVTENGFEPSTINVKPGTNVDLKITRKTNSTCAREILIPSKNIKKELPLNKAVNIQTGKLERGEITFACGMNMVTGVIVVK
jgi:plastocyanin domain-containing protein